MNWNRHSKKKDPNGYQNYLEKQKEESLKNKILFDEVKKRVSKFKDENEQILNEVIKDNILKLGAEHQFYIKNRIDNLIEDLCYENYPEMNKQEIFSHFLLQEEDLF